LEAVEMLSSGNLIASAAGGSPSAPSSPVDAPSADGANGAPPASPTSATALASSARAPPCTVESLSWLLGSFGLDPSEVSIDALIQMQQHPALVRSFTSARQVVAALQLLYTQYDEDEVREEARREGLQPKVVQFLVQECRSAAAAAASSTSASSGDLTASQMMVVEPLSLTHLTGGVKRTRLARAKRRRELRAKVIEFQLQTLDDEDWLGEGEGEVPVEHGPASAAKPKYQQFELQHSDRSVLLARNRLLHPLPALSLSALAAALNGCAGLISSGLPLSEGELANLVAELVLQLGEGDCEVDLVDLDKMKQANAEEQAAEPLLFSNPKQCLMALQLLNVDFVSPAEFESSCARAGFSPAVRAFLLRHARAAAGWRLLSRAEARGAPAAKYAVLEAALRKQEEEEWAAEEELMMEEQQMMQMQHASSYADDEVQIGGGAQAQAHHAKALSFVEEDFSSEAMLVSSEGGAEEGDGVGTAGARDSARPKAIIASHDLAFSDESGEMVVGPVSLSPRVGRLTLAELAAHLAGSKLLEGDAASLLASPSAASVALGEQLGSLDRELALADLQALEAQGGLKFRSARQLVAALALVQEEGYDAGDEVFSAELDRRAAADKFSPSVAQFLFLLHRSPARRDRLTVIRGGGRRRQGGSARGAGGARASTIMQSTLIREEGEDGEWAGQEQLVNAKQLAQCIQSHASSLFVTEAGGDDGSALMVEDVNEPLVQELLLQYSTLSDLPESVIEADLSALARQGARVRSTKDLVHVLQLMHSRPEKQIDQDEVQLLFADADAAGQREAKAKNVEFLLQYRLQSALTDRNVRVPVRRGSITAAKAKKSVVLSRPFDEAELMVEEVDASSGEPLDASVVAHRRAQVLARALRQSTLLEQPVEEEAALVEELERHVVSMDFSLEPGHFEALQRLEAEARAALQDGAASGRVGLKPIVLALQLINEADTLALDRVAIEARAAALPPPLAQYVLVRTAQEEQLSQCMTRRRRETLATARTASRRASAAAAASAVPEAKLLRVDEQPLSVELLEQELGYELMLTDEGALVDDDITSDDALARGARALRQACVEMELDLSEVTLGELRVLRSAPSWRRVRTPRQAVQILALSRFNAEPALTKARVLNELERLEQQQGGQRAQSSAQKHATVQLLFDLEEELMLAAEEEEAVGAPSAAASAERRATVMQMPSDSDGHLGVSVVVPSATSSSETSPDPEGALSPPPPPFPAQLRASSNETGTAGSPPVPRYPFSSASAGSTRSSLETTLHPNILTPSPPPPVHPLPRGVSESVHIRFHSSDESTLPQSSPPQAPGQSPEAALVALVAQINGHSLCKNPSFSGASELPMSVGDLNFPRLSEQVEQLAVRARERNLRDRPVFESPAHCVRCLYADVLPAALDPAAAPIAVALDAGSGGGSGAPLSPSSSVSATSSLGEDASEDGESAALTTGPAAGTGPAHHRGGKNASQTEQQLIEQHIAHIRGSMILQPPKGHRGSKEIPPAQETESPPVAGCCGKQACSIM